MVPIRFFIRFAPDVQARWFIEKGSQKKEWEESIFDSALTAEERAHLLVMARSPHYRILRLTDSPLFPVTQVYATDYRPVVDFADINRVAHQISDYNEEDDEVISLIFSAAAPIDVARAAIVADRRRYEAAREELNARVPPLIEAWLHQANERLHELRRWGADAITEREIQYGERPRKPGWFEAASVFGYGAQVAEVWDALNKTFNAALSIAQERREAQKRARNE